MHICSECGQTIPEDSDFCYYCGALKKKAFETDEKGEVKTGVCHSCGSPVKPHENFCRSCGAALMTSSPIIMPLKLKKNAFLALILALIPGFFHVYGLGHLVLKQYLRGAMFLALSVILFISTGYFKEHALILMMLDLGVFLFQMMDVMKFMYESDQQ